MVTQTQSKLTTYINKITIALITQCEIEKSYQ